MLIALLAVLALLKNTIDNRRGTYNNEPSTSTSKSIIEANQNLKKTKKQKEIKTSLNSLSDFDIMNNFHSQNKPISLVGDDQVDDTIPGVIVFKAGDKQSCHEILDKNVKVVCSPGVHDHGSSKVKLKNVVDYKWENKYYMGHLIAAHIDGKHIAYVINVSTKVSRTEGMVRVVNAKSGARALIKGMCGEVLDLQFAQIEKERILGSIDVNSLCVHKIEPVDKDTMICNLILRIDDPLNNYTPKYDKITWCPVMKNDADESNLVIWSRGSTLQCFNVKTVIAKHGAGRHTTNNLKEGYIRLHDESITITWIAVAPDGSTFSVGTMDGFIRFYQIYMHDKEPRCLHQWKPHDGKPISSFFFLDTLTKNVTDYVPVKTAKRPPYWTLAITAAANNTEFKVWDCGAWKCLQTVTLALPAEDKKPHFLAEIDRTSSYLVISNLETRNCYVLQVINNSVIDDADTSSSSQDSNISSVKSLTVPPIFIKSISEFPLSSGILSFSIVDAAVRRYKCSNENYLCEEFDEYDEETNSLYCVVVRMFIVQPKSMQECCILYQPTLTENAEVESSISYDSNAMNESKESRGLDGSAASMLNNCKKSNKDEIEVMEKSIKILQREKKDKEKSERNPLEALLGISNNGSSNEQITIQTTTTTTSSIMAVAAATAPTTISSEKTDSNTVSPRLTNIANKSFTQLNLMTPDAFGATTATTTATTANDKKTPEVSSDVLNTILMLASVAGPAPASKNDNVNLLNLVNNKIIEDQEHKKMQLKQQLESQKKFKAIDNNPGRDNLASGGSSPSREVQEILSLQEYDKSSYSGDELLDEQAILNEDDGAENEFLDVSVTDHDTNKKSKSITSWPKAPEVPKVPTKHSAELQNAANLITQAVNNSGGNMNSSHPPTLVNSANRSSSGNLAINANNTSNNVDLAEINMKMNQLLDLVKLQSSKINSLQKEVIELKSSNSMVSTKNFTDFSFKLEMQLSKLLEQYLKRYENDHKKKLTAFMSAQEVQMREMRDSITQMTHQYVLTQIGEVVAKVVTFELQRQLGPILSAQIEHMQKQLQLDVAQKLSAFDKMLKDNIVQACKSKNIIDAFGKSVLIGVQGSLQTAFIESMSSTLIPAYEKSSQSMFKQLHDAFSVGIKEFVEQFNNYLQHLQPMHDSSNEVLSKLSTFVPQLDLILAKHRNVYTEAMQDTRKDVKSLEILLTRQIQETLRAELRKAMDHTVALRSQANTPAPIFDIKESVKHFLQQGQINKAFHQALLANDLSLVEYTLSHADQSAVFTPECCLEQKVLLSLIQQISADMSNHNEIKQNYLAEAILAIDLTDPITREHAPKVLQDLYRNCQIYLLSQPKSPQCSNVRMVMKAVTTLLPMQFK